MYGSTGAPTNYAPPTSCAPALRAGRVWVPGSRRHADPASYLLPSEQRQQTRATAVANEASRLGKLIETRLPEIDLPDLLIEVDGSTNFTDQLVPLSGNRGRPAGPAGTG